MHGHAGKTIGGEIRGAIAKGLRNPSDGPRAMFATSFGEAMTMSRESAASGDVVLLSLGCASDDWFNNYEVRRQTFRRQGPGRMPSGLSNST
ncbi:MAG: hypothetical protein HZA51_04720 [Planctomycetes bacterium]|nr:hypothetical protein [Planctomycetota bacterium]